MKGSWMSLFRSTFRVFGPVTRKFQRMDNFPLPVFNIESDEDEGEADSMEVIETKPVKKCDHLHKLLADRSIHPPSNNPNMILKKLETIAEENLLRKDLVESVYIDCLK